MPCGSWVCHARWTQGSSKNRRLLQAACPLSDTLLPALQRSGLYPICCIPPKARTRQVRILSYAYHHSLSKLARHAAPMSMTRMTRLHLLIRSARPSSRASSPKLWPWHTESCHGVLVVEGPGSVVLTGGGGRPLRPSSTSKGGKLCQAVEARHSGLGKFEACRVDLACRV